MSTLHTEEMTLNMGPQHPSTHGVLRFVVRADGEVMREAIPDVGYLHRSIEKIAEKVGYHGFMPYTDRVDYVCAMFTNQGWGMACEKLADIEVPHRGEYCRVIAAEFNRIASHLLSVGAMAMDIGAVTPFTHAIREREMINDLIEELCGARLTFNYMRIGGVAWDLPPGWREKALAYLDHFDPILEEYNALISWNKIYIERLANVGVITPEEADQLQPGRARTCARAESSGTSARTSRIRCIRSSSSTCRLATGIGASSATRWIATWCGFARWRESSKILRQALQKIPRGPVLAKVARNFKPPAGECQIRLESGRGDMGWYVVSDGTGYPWRVHVRTGSFAAMGIIQKLSAGLMIADLVTLIASLDVIAPEIDR